MTLTSEIAIGIAVGMMVRPVFASALAMFLAHGWKWDGDTYSQPKPRKFLYLLSMYL